MDAPQIKPATVEVSGKQTVKSPGIFSNYQIPGVPAPEPGTYALYRKMASHPAIVLASIVAFSPLKSSQWSFEASDNAPSDAVEKIQKNLENMRPFILNECLRAVNMGWYGAEKIFEAKDGWFGLKKLKSLLHDITDIKILESGAFQGFAQDEGKTLIPLEKSFLFTHDQEAGNLHGRSRLENARMSGIWSAWVDAHDGAARYDRKIAGVFPIIHYPKGDTFIDRNGQTKDAHEIAESFLNSLQAGKGIATPNEFTGGNDSRNAAGPERRQWLFELLEDKGGRQPTFITRLEYLDKCLLRSYMVPERSASEATSAGSRADSGTAADVVIAQAELMHQDIARCINWHIVDQLLALNYGESARGSVYITPQPINDTQRTLITAIVKEVLVNPASVDMLLSFVDFDAMLDQAGLPKNEQAAANIEAKTNHPELPDNSKGTPTATKAMLSLVQSIAKRG